MIRNFPLTTKDSVRSDHIYGPDITLIEGNMKRHSNPGVKVPIISLPEDILSTS